MTVKKKKKTFVHLFTHKEGQVTPVTDLHHWRFSWKMHFTIWLLQDIKPHGNHGILIKLSSLIRLYNSFFYNSLTIKQVIPVSSTKSFIWKSFASYIW